MKQTLKIVLPLLIGLTVAYLLFRNDFDYETLHQIHFDSRAWTGLALALLCVCGREAGMAWRYRLLSGNRLTRSASLKVTMMCEFTSCITPTSVGGSAASAIFMTRYGIAAGRSTAIMLTTLFLDELFITIIVPVTFLIVSSTELFGFSNGNLAHDLQVGFWTVYIILALWCIILWIGIFIAPKSLRALLIKLFSLPLIKRWRPSIEALGNDLVSTSTEFRHLNFSTWIKAFAATALSWLSRFLTVNALLWGFVVGANQLLAFARQIATWVLLMLTPTPGGSGISEWIFTNYYGDIVSGSALIMMLALSWRILTYYIYFPIGIALIPSLSKKST